MPKTFPLTQTFSRRSLLLGSAALSLGGAPLAALAEHGVRRRGSMTLAQKVAQLFVVSFGGVTAPDPAFLSLLRRHPLGGVILYGRNCTSAGQVRSLVQSLQRASSRRLLVCTDQEGGEVVRIAQGVDTFPSEATYGHAGSVQRVQADAATTARQLRSIGLTMNLAPVVDVLTNPSSPIGDRSFGPNPALDARLAAAAIRGYQANGLAATAKHFVGLGHTSIDSHARLPSVPLTLAQLDKNDFIPFRSAIAAGVSTILVAHVALPRIDPSGAPASLSRPVIQGVIRGHLGFKGAIMTDSLAMGAIPNGDTRHAAVKALHAGADILLIGTDRDIPTSVVDAAISAILSAVRSGTLPASRIDSALANIQVLKTRFGS